MDGILQFFTNPVTLSVILMVLLCLKGMNVILSLLISAIVGGFIGGFSPQKSMELLISGMGANGETALSYVLLGAFAISVSETGVAEWVAQKVMQVTKSSKFLLLLAITLMGCASQNILPVHIAFIPLVIPPLLKVMNKIGLDRRAVSCALTFGLTTPYMAIPVGFGLIYHRLIKEQMIANGVDIEIGSIAKAMFIPAMGMFTGLLVALFITYRKSREYEDREIDVFSNSVKEVRRPVIIKTLIAAVVAFTAQLITESLALGAIAGLLVMFATNAISWKQLSESMNGGVKTMGFIAIVMLVAAGFGQVVRETGGTQELVELLTHGTLENRFFAVAFMLLVGLLVTLGIGSSFGTIPILATIYCPLGVELGFSTLAITAILGVAGALGDAGSPASDSTLGPTSGLGMDNQHDHIWDTCVPTFVHFNIPLIIAGIIAAMVL